MVYERWTLGLALSKSAMGQIKYKNQVRFGVFVLKKEKQPERFPELKTPV